MGEAPAQEEFSLPPFLQIRRYLPHAALGVAGECLDTRSRKPVIVQRYDAFTQEDIKNILLDLRLQKRMKHKNVLTLVDCVPYSLDHTHFFVVRDYYPGQLAKIIESPQELSIDHVQFFIYQLLCCLRYLHSAGLYCKELNPAVVITNKDCEIQVVDVDFSLNQPLQDAMNMPQNTRQSRTSNWYYAPEVLACSPNVGPVANIWSLGCIFAELLTRRPLLPGNNLMHQLCLIASFLKPSEADLTSVTTRSLILNKMRQSTQQDTGRSIASALREATPPAIDLVTKLAHRPSAAEALKHEFFADIYDESEMIDSPVVFDKAAVSPPSFASLDEAKAALAAETNSSS